MKPAQLHPLVIAVTSAMLLTPISTVGISKNFPNTKDQIAHNAALLGDTAWSEKPSPSNCAGGQAWKWTYGPENPETALQAREALRKIGIVADVTAREFGETDNCENYLPYAVDLRIEVRSFGESHVPSESQAFADKLRALVASELNARLGRFDVILPNGLTVTASDTTTLKSIASSQLASSSSPPTAWQSATPASSPSARYTHGMAFDSDRGVTVVFGGDNSGSSRLNDTWEYDGADWHQVTSANLPPARANIDQTLVYDPARRKIILFGGLGTSAYLNDTWEFNGANWAQVTASPSPPARDSHSMSFDTSRKVTVLFGGSGYSGRLADTWEYNGTWQQRFPATSPSARIHHAMAYDSRRQVTVLFGGLNSANTPLGDTWEYDGSTWRLATPLNSPAGRHNHSMAYDSARGVIVLFGGETASGPVNDTWEYDGISWRQSQSSQSPSARVEMGVIYDSLRHTVVLFGGGRWSSTLTLFSDLWKYRPVLSNRLPLNRRVYVIVYDPVLQNGDRLSTRLGWNSHSWLTAQTIDFFKQTSASRVNYSVVYTTVVSAWPTKIDGFQYTESTYPLLGPGRTPHSPDNVNYNAIVNNPEFDICGKANRNEIDEVWIYNGPYFGFWESTLAGPGAYWFNSPPVSGPVSCARMVPIMGPSPERGVAEAVHNFGHRMESTMTQVYGSWQQNNTTHSWNKYALVKALSPGYSYSGCGNIHYPPNGQSDYNYGNTSATATNCPDFENYPTLNDPLTVSRATSCASWACAHLQYLAYWFGHLPTNTGCGADHVANDWWRYFANPSLALAPGEACNQQSYLPLARR